MSFGENPMRVEEIPSEKNFLREKADITRMTRSEIRKLQQELGIVADGIAGKQTREALKKRNQGNSTKEAPNFFEKFFSGFGNDNQPNDNQPKKVGKNINEKGNDNISDKEKFYEVYGNQIPWSHRSSVNKFLNEAKLKGKEIYRHTPIAIGYIDPMEINRGTCIYLKDGKLLQTFPITVGWGGVDDRKNIVVASGDNYGDGKTATGIYTFKRGQFGNEKPGITGARLISEMSNLGARHWHGTNATSRGCVTMDDVYVKEIANAINKSQGGYGFIDGIPMSSSQYRETIKRVGPAIATNYPEFRRIAGRPIKTL